MAEVVRDKIKRTWPISFYFNTLYRSSFIILYNDPKNAQILHKLSHSSYMFRHYCVILRELVVSTLLSYTSMSNAAVGNV
jgi:hypothetical protein